MKDKELYDILNKQTLMLSELKADSTIIKDHVIRNETKIKEHDEIINRVRPYFGLFKRPILLIFLFLLTLLIGNYLIPNVEISSVFAKLIKLIL